MPICYAMIRFCFFFGWLLIKEDSRSFTFYGRTRAHSMRLYLTGPKIEIMLMNFLWHGSIKEEGSQYEFQSRILLVP